MTKETFDEYIRRLREESNLPLGKVAAQLDVEINANYKKLEDLEDGLDYVINQIKKNKM
jgi:hypothetical protein